MTAPPYSLGSRNVPGLGKLMEEAGEVVQVGGKIIGLGEMGRHWDGSDLTKRAGEEVADLSGACRAFFQLNGFDGAPWVLERENAKYRQFLKWHFDNLEDKPDGVGEGPRGFNKLERFLGAGSDLHHQIYWSWRIYPSAMLHTAFIFLMLGLVIGFLPYILSR